MKSKTKKTKVVWEKVGEVGVDSGQLVVCDPCYIDDQWERGVEPAGHPPYTLSKKGRELFPQLGTFTVKWPFEWGNYGDVCPQLGMSINDARKQELMDEVDVDPLRDFNYRGACDVSHLTGENFGQLNYKKGHAGAGVAFSSGYGDGIYPVFARRNSDGRIVEVRILMDSTPAQLKALGIKG